MPVKLLGSVTDERLVQKANTLLDRVVTVLGIMTLFSDEHRANAL